eukprot:8521421-Alexandrium_andersonii.AAC.1
MLRPFLGPRSSCFKRLKQLRIFRKADGGLRRVAALTGIERIAGCTLDPSQCKDYRTSAPTPL